MSHQKKLFWKSSSLKKNRYLKGGFLIIALICFLSLILWPYLSFYMHALNHDIFPNDSEKAVLTQESKTVAKKISFHGMDQSNQPYTLIAKGGDEKNSGVTFLINPHLTLHLKSGNIINLTSEMGEYDQKKEMMTLKKHVVITHSRGHEFITSCAWIDLKTSIAYGTDPIQGKSPKGIIDAPQGFKVSKEGEEIYFFGRPSLLLHVGKQ